MLRELTQIILAIHLSGGNHLPQKQVERFAHAIQEQSERIDMDAFVFTTIIAHESNWNERARSQDGLDIGLGQIRVAHFGNQTSFLLDGGNNIRAMAFSLNLDREFCRKRLGREPELQEMLAGYTGSVPWCKPNALTKQFEDYKNCIENEVDRGAEVSECRRIFKPVCRFGGKIVNCDGK